MTTTSANGARSASERKSASTILRNVQEITTFAAAGRTPQRFAARSASLAFAARTNSAEMSKPASLSPQSAIVPSSVSATGNFLAMASKRSPAPHVGSK